jgi:hypothetical protein
MEGELNGAGGYDEEVRELSPVDYLVSVMHDPDAAPSERIKAARVATPYLHAHPGIEDMPIVIEDPFGFPVDPVVAKEIREDQQRAKALKRPVTLEEAMDFCGKGKPLPPDSPEYRELKAQIDQRLNEIGCPASYGGREARADEARISDLSPNANRGAPQKPLTAEEAAERDHLQFRVSVYRASPAGEAHARMADLLRRKQGTLTPVEESELDELRRRYPERMDAIAAKKNNQTTELKRPNGAHGGSGAPSYAGSAAPPISPPPSHPTQSVEPQKPAAAPTISELIERQQAQEAEQIRRRRAAGDPDPWDGNAPSRRIHQLEERRYDKKLTLAQEEELEHITRLYPEAVERIRTMLARRLKEYYARREQTRRLGYDPGPDEGWPRIGYKC